MTSFINDFLPSISWELRALAIHAIRTNDNELFMKIVDATLFGKKPGEDPE